jgi:hypothetical protein
MAWISAQAASISPQPATGHHGPGQREFRRHRGAGQAHAQPLGAELQQAAALRQRGLLAGSQPALAQCHAIAAVGHAEQQPAVGRRRQHRMVRRHVRVVQHAGVVQRTAQRHRPGMHVQRAAHPAVAVEQLDQREAVFGAAAGVQPNPSR